MAPCVRGFIFFDSVCIIANDVFHFTAVIRSEIVKSGGKSMKIVAETTLSFVKMFAKVVLN